MFLSPRRRPVELLSLVFVLSLSAGGEASPMTAIQIERPFAIGNLIQTTTLGWSFQATDNLEVVSLGFWDLSGDGLVNDHRVSIWDTAGNSLTTTTIPMGTGAAYTPDGGVAPPGGFRFVDIAPLQLNAGQVYVIGAEYFTGGGDSTWLFQTDPSSSSKPLQISTAPGITYLGARGLNGSFGFPTGPDTNPPLGSFGPNFQFQLAASVPEPASLALWSVIMGIGCFGLPLFSRRRACL